MGKRRYEQQGLSAEELIRLYEMLGSAKQVKYALEKRNIYCTVETVKNWLKELGIKLRWGGYWGAVPKTREYYEKVKFDIMNGKIKKVKELRINKGKQTDYAFVTVEGFTLRAFSTYILCKKKGWKDLKGFFSITNLKKYFPYTGQYHADPSSFWQILKEIDMGLCKTSISVNGQFKVICPTETWSNVGIRVRCLKEGIDIKYASKKYIDRKRKEREEKYAEEKH